MPQEQTYHEYTRQPEVFERLDIENLSFRYPGTDRYILRHLNLSLEKGKSYSLVGINGAGKSTLIKLLTGVYKEFEGTIRLNGRDIRLYTDNQLRNMFSLVYQDYSKYQISIKDNLTFGNEDFWDPSVLEKADLKDVVDNLKEREYTLLGKIEGDGVDLSGGEWPPFYGRTYAYLLEERFLDREMEIITFFVREKLLYEDAEHHNAVAGGTCHGDR